MKRIIVLALGCLAMLSVGAAGAYFTAQAQVPENVIKAGSVAISTEATTAAISVDSLAPGCVATKTLTVTNDGALPSSVVVSAQKKAGYTDMYEALTCRVATADGEVYDGPMSALKTQAVRIDPGQRDVRSDARDKQQRQRVEDSRAKLGNLHGIGESGKHGRQVRSLMRDL